MTSTGEGGPPTSPAPRSTRRPSEPSPSGAHAATTQAPRVPEGAMARTGGGRPPSQARGDVGPGSPSAQSARPATAGGAPRPRRRGPRRVRLTLQRVDPWSVMKISFLLSVAMGIAGVIMVALLWTVLSGMGVFSELNGFIADLTQGEGGGSGFDLMDYLGFGRVVSLAVVIGVIDVILLTAMATLGAFLYNICTSLVGGAQVTLSDE